MLYRVVHHTGYEYTGEVSVSQHVARLRPRALPRQRVREFTCAVEPAPASALGERTDYYGNTQTFFTVEGAHRRLAVVARSVVVGGARHPARAGGNAAVGDRRDAGRGGCRCVTRRGRVPL